MDAHPSQLPLAQGPLKFVAVPYVQLSFVLLRQGEGVMAGEQPDQDTAQTPGILALEVDLVQKLFAGRQIESQDFWRSKCPGGQDLIRACRQAKNNQHKQMQAETALLCNL